MTKEAAIVTSKGLNGSWWNGFGWAWVWVLSMGLVTETGKEFLELRKEVALLKNRIQDLQSQTNYLFQIKAAKQDK